MTAYIPYCGTPPIPGAVAWNLDPALMAVLLGGFGLYFARAGSQVGPGPRLSFLAGWLLLAAAFVSPLCNLSVALFSARVGQHMLVTLVALPLLALGRVDLTLPQRPAGAAAGRPRPPGLRAAAWLGFALALWAWHLPGPYDATLRSDLAYWAMHASLIGTGLLLWTVVLRDVREAPGAAFLTSIATTIQMAFLGALLTLAPRPLFEVHELTTWPWGLTPLQDQQLGGVLMWVPGGITFTAVSLWSVLQLLNLGRSATARAQPAWTGPS